MMVSRCAASLLRRIQERDRKTSATSQAVNLKPGGRPRHEDAPEADVVGAAENRQVTDISAFDSVESRVKEAKIWLCVGKCLRF